MRCLLDLPHLGSPGRRADDIMEESARDQLSGELGSISLSTPSLPVTFSNEKNLSELGQSKKNRVRGLLVVRLTLLCHPKLSLTKSLSVLLTALLAYFPGNDWAPR